MPDMHVPAISSAPSLPTTSRAVAPIIPTTYGEVFQIAKATCAGGLAPKFKNDPARVASVMMCGMELGLKPMASLRLFFVTPEGQPALTARGQLAVVQQSGLLARWDETLDGEGDDRAA